MSEDKSLSMTIVAYALASMLMIGSGWLFSVVVSSLRDLNSGQNKIKEKVASNTSGLSSIQEIMTRQTKVMERVSRNEADISNNDNDIIRLQNDIRIIHEDNKRNLR